MARAHTLFRTCSSDAMAIMEVSWWPHSCLVGDKNESINQDKDSMGGTRVKQGNWQHFEVLERKANKGTPIELGNYDHHMQTMTHRIMGVQAGWCQLAAGAATGRPTCMYVCACCPPPPSGPPCPLFPLWPRQVNASSCPVRSGPLKSTGQPAGSNCHR